MRYKNIYLHFPFCETKCHYCDFYSLAHSKVRNEDVQRFEKAFNRELIQHHSLLAENLETLFMGGGTPSMTDPEVMTRILEPLADRISPKNSYEWTMEANPSSLNKDKLKKYRALGVNRISLGVQAFRDDHLTMLGRAHNRDRALRATGDVFESGFCNVSVDLLCGIPGQSLADLEKALETFISYPITHLSCYLLTLPKGHFLFSKLPDENTQLEHLLFLDSWMSRHGFEHYEISNFAKPGFKARHNMNYWQGGSYLGFGPSAHSYDAGQKKRWKNVSSLSTYIQRLEQNQLCTEWEETLEPKQVSLENWMLSLRLNDGFPEHWLSTPHQKEKALHLIKTGFLELHPQKKSYLRLTPHGFALSDDVVSGLSN